MIRRLLVANRGEIAVRIMRTARDMGIETVAVYSDADTHALHTRQADTAVHIGPAPAAGSYLSTDTIIAAARDAGADAVHPGYGFLSENADFAQAVQDAGLVFVGPTADVIRQMGCKRTARGIAEKAGVPVVPGFDGADTDDARLAKEADRIGFPLMIKATAGGGGRGLRRVASAPEFKDALQSARREAGSAFGDSGIILERLIDEARHVEVQILGDTHGTVVHLFERDCSSQRRHQKVIEEAPCATISEATRAGLTDAAVKLARAVGYTGAGTVEFLVDEAGNYYFLEMNTRLQVEHPVTELVTGLDLVAEQLKVAAGARLAFTQDDISLSGHAIEVRLYAEDPSQNHMPQTGTLGVFDIETPPGTRLDSGVVAGSTVSPYYDPMLAKLIAHGATREEARSRLLAMLRQSRIAGVATNKGWLIHLLAGAGFRDGSVRTHTLDREPPPLPEPAPEQAMIAASALQAQALQAAPMPALAGWRSLHTSADRRVLDIGGERFSLALTQQRTANGWRITATTDDLTSVADFEGDLCRLDGKAFRLAHHAEGETHHFDTGTAHITARDMTHAPAERAAAGATGQLKAPMDGQIVAVGVAPGETVMAGDLICVIEAMKMEHHIRADMDGIITTLTASVGAQVKNRAALATIEPGETA